MQKGTTTLCNRPIRIGLPFRLTLEAEYVPKCYTFSMMNNVEGNMPRHQKLTKQTVCWEARNDRTPINYSGPISEYVRSCMHHRMAKKTPLSSDNESTANSQDSAYIGCTLDHIQYNIETQINFKFHLNAGIYLQFRMLYTAACADTHLSSVRQ